MTPPRTRAPAVTLRPPYTTSSTLVPAETINSQPRGITRPHGRASASATRPPATFATATATATARATSTATTPPPWANCCTYPPTVLIRPCPPSAQYRLTSAYPNATAAAAYAATAASAHRPRAARANRPPPGPVLPIVLQY